MGPVAYMVSTKLLVGLLGIVLAFAPASFYPFYEHHPHYWGLSPSEDQSMAGLLMALEQSIVMGIALVVGVRPDAGRVRARGAARGALRGGVSAGPRAESPGRRPPRATRRLRYLLQGAEPLTVWIVRAGAPVAVGRLAVNVVEYGRLPFRQPTDAEAATVLPLTFLVTLEPVRCSVSSEPARPGAGKLTYLGTGTSTTRYLPWVL